MSTTSVHPAAGRFAQWDVWRCLNCQSPLVPKGDQSALACDRCGGTVPIEDDILILMDQTASNNQIAQSFYDSPLWPKFRFWEYVTWFCNGGEKRARSKVLRHLPTAPGLELLDVAIGDGAYLEWLPADWKIAGVDISRSQLEQCRRRAAGRDVWLGQCEAEHLPFDDQRFDAVLSIGAFNYFSDPEGALREMARVAKKGVMISDSNNIGQGKAYARLLKYLIKTLGLWRALVFVQTGGRMYKFSEGDGVYYSYTAFDAVKTLQRKFPTIHYLNTQPCAGSNLYRGAGHVMLLARG